MEFQSKSVAEIPARESERKPAISDEQVREAVKILRSGEAIELQRDYAKPGTARAAAHSLRKRISEVEPQVKPGQRVSTLVYSENGHHRGVVLLRQEPGRKPEPKPAPKRARKSAK